MKKLETGIGLVNITALLRVLDDGHVSCAKLDYIMSLLQDLNVKNIQAVTIEPIECLSGVEKELMDVHEIENIINQ